MKAPSRSSVMLHRNLDFRRDKYHVSGGLESSLGQPDVRVTTGSVDGITKTNLHCLTSSTQSFIWTAKLHGWRQHLHQHALVSVKCKTLSPLTNTVQGYTGYRNDSAPDRGCASKRIRTCKSTGKEGFAASVEVLCLLAKPFVNEELLRISEHSLHLHPCSPVQASIQSYDLR